jgi:hypothetical protein
VHLYVITSERARAIDGATELPVRLDQRLLRAGRVVLVAFAR